MAKGYGIHCSKKGRDSIPLQRPQSRRQRTRSRAARRQSKRRRKPLPAFFLFMEDKRCDLQCDHPDWNVIEIAQKLGCMWHQQSEADKDMYKKEAAQLRQQFFKKKAGKHSKSWRKKKKRRSDHSRCKELMRDLEHLACC